MTLTFKLADGFADPNFSDWEERAHKALKGAALDRLTATTYDSIAIKPLYTATDAEGRIYGKAAAARDLFLPWDIRQTVLDSDPARANAVALHDLERGVSSIEFHIDPSGAHGVKADNPDTFAILTKGIFTSLATVALNAPHDPLQVATDLSSAIGQNDRTSAKLAFNLDPMAQIMSGGGALSLSDAVQFAKQAAVTFPAATALRADARPIHEGGGSEAQELAVLIASGIAHVKAGDEIGLSPAQTNASLLFTLSVGPDVVLEIAKLKAARRMWARVMQAFGHLAPMRLQAVTSGRMQTIADPWTNILRATCAAFAAGAGGAEIVTVLPFTSAFAVADESARRIARNTQLILQEESHLGRVGDPAAGAWAIETLADDLAKAAWGLVQEIEKSGGLEAALGLGLVQGWVSQTRAARERDVARRKTPLIGVSLFPNLAEELKIATMHPQPTAKGAIAPMRLSEPYEALRARDLTSSSTIFLATLGAISQFNARAGFARNAFEAGGIKTIGEADVHADDAAIVAAFVKSGAKIACLCSDDASYESRASTMALALKKAGAVTIWLAGKGNYDGVDRAIFSGADILAELSFAHQTLEGAL
jgi:methylmalonyl-CoA mutase